MPLYYEEVMGGGYPEVYTLSISSEERAVSSELLAATLPVPEENAQTQLEFVSPLEIEINPSSPTPQTPKGTFSLPPAFLQAQSANASQVHGHLRPVEQDKNKASTSTAWKSGKGNGDNECTLDEFWYEDGKDWDKVNPSEEESELLGEAGGMAACTTAPECFTCGTKLTLEQIVNPGVPCRVCHCFN